MVGVLAADDVNEIVLIREFYGVISLGKKPDLSLTVKVVNGTIQQVFTVFDYTYFSHIAQIDLYAARGPESVNNEKTLVQLGFDM
jgi:hypothetical protein